VLKVKLLKGKGDWLRKRGQAPFSKNKKGASPLLRGLSHFSGGWKQGTRGKKGTGYFFAKQSYLEKGDRLLFRTLKKLPVPFFQGKATQSKLPAGKGEETKPYEKQKSHYYSCSGVDDNHPGRRNRLLLV
jgi:hypothetical protein